MKREGLFGKMALSKFCLSYTSLREKTCSLQASSMYILSGVNTFIPVEHLTF